MGPQGIGMFSGVSCWGKGKAEAWCQPEGVLVSQKQISHSSDNLLDNSARKGWNPDDDLDCLALETSLAYVNEFHVRTSKID